MDISHGSKTNKTVLDVKINADIKNIENLITIDADLLNYLKKTLRIIEQPAKIKKLKLKQTHGRELDTIILNLENLENFDKLFPIYQDQIKKIYPNVVLVSIENNKIELMYKISNDKDDKKIFNEHFQSFLDNFYPYLETSIDNISLELLSYIQMNRKKFSEEYSISIMINEDSMILKGPEKKISSFLDFSQTFIVNLIPIENLNLADGFLVDKYRDLLNVSATVIPECQALKFFGPPLIVEEAVRMYNKYKLSAQGQLFNGEVEHPFLRNILLKNENFYQAFKTYYPRIMNLDFVDINKTTENTIFISCQRQPGISEGEKRIQMFHSVQQVFLRAFSSVQIYPLLDDSYMDSRLHQLFIQALKNDLMFHFRLNQEDFYICEIFNQPIEFKEYLPGVCYTAPRTTICCYTLFNFDIGTIFSTVTFKKCSFTHEQYNFLVKSKDFERLLNTYTTKSRDNKIDFKEDEFSMTITGKFIDMEFVVTCIAHYVAFYSVVGLVIPDFINIMENEQLIREIVKYGDIRDFLFYLQNNQFLRLCAKNKQKLEVIVASLFNLLSNFKSEIRPFRRSFVEYLKNNMEIFKKKFHAIIFVVLNETDVIIRGRQDCVDYAFKYIEDVMTTVAGLPADFIDFYNFIDGDTVNGIFIGETIDGWWIEGESEKVNYLIWLYGLNLRKTEIEFRDVRYRKLVVDKYHYPDIKILFEFDSRTLSYFKRLHCPDWLVELSHVSEDVIVYIEEDDDRYIHLDVPKAIEEMCKTYYQEIKIPLGLNQMVNFNSELYKKLTEKLNDLKYSLEFEWGLRFAARFEMDEFDQLKIIAQESTIEGLRREIMKLKYEQKINFETNYLINNEFFKRINYDSAGKVWNFNVVNDCILFTGPYVYYIFFNILFEQYLFSSNYQLPECVFKIKKFPEFARLFQRSRQLLDEFKETLLDDLKQCRCEMRAFEDELIIEPSFELINKFTSLDLCRQYNNAFDFFTRQKFLKKKIKILFGDYLQTDNNNLLKHFTAVLNAEIRLIEKSPFEPLLVSVNILPGKNAILINGFQEYVDLVAGKLCAFVNKSFDLQLFRDTQRIMDDLFHQLVRNLHVFKNTSVYKIKARFVDYLFLRTYFDINCNGLYFKIPLDKTTIQLKYENVLNAVIERLRNEFKQNNALCVVNFGKSQIETSIKTYDTVQQGSVILKDFLHYEIQLFQHELDFFTSACYTENLEFSFSQCMYFFNEIIIDKENSKVKLKCSLNEIEKFRRIYGNMLSTVKSLGDKLYIKEILKIKNFQNVFDNLNQHLEGKVDGKIKILNDFSGIVFKVPLADYAHISALLEYMMRMIRIYVYKVEYKIYEHILYKMFPQYIFTKETVEVGFEYCNNHMLIYSYENDEELNQVLQAVNFYLISNEKYSSFTDNNEFQFNCL